ncbi:MAG: glycosyltransferase family 2 protein [Bacteroidales bacterium]|nr:glycosyltransferase family 2 protein [Bacteroidales bacterium]
MISIIIPIYNAEPYLDKCLNTIFLQNSSYWECIMVNDGSTDNSAEICKRWISKDSRFRLINQLNKGVSAARNFGIENSKGDWIAFVDADDWLEPNYLAAMAELTTGTDLVVSGQIREFDNGKTLVYKPNATETFTICPNKANQFNELNLKFLLYAPHEKLFRSDIIKKNNLEFQVGCSYGEDLQFVYSYLEHIDTVSTIDKALYHYRMVDSGTLSTKFRRNQFDEDYRQWLIVYGFYERHGLLCELSNQYLAKRLWGIVYDGIFLYPKLNDNRKHYVNRILSIPEIGYLKIYDYVFQTAKWIKWAILNRFASVFTLYFKCISSRFI